MTTFALVLQKFAEKTGAKADLAVGNIVSRIAYAVTGPWETTCTKIVFYLDQPNSILPILSARFE